MKDGYTRGVLAFVSGRTGRPGARKRKI